MLQERQSKYEVILRSVRTSTVIVESCIKYSECVFVALGTQRAMRMLHIVICDLSDFTVFFNIISYTA